MTVLGMFGAGVETCDRPACVLGRSGVCFQEISSFGGGSSQAAQEQQQMSSLGGPSLSAAPSVSAPSPVALLAWLRTLGLLVWLC